MNREEQRRRDNARWTLNVWKVASARFEGPPAAAVIALVLVLAVIVVAVSLRAAPWLRR